jgi:hypothetical protein
MIESGVADDRIVGIAPQEEISFRDNAIDPLQFRASLKMRAPKVEYLQLPHAEIQLLS